MADSPRTSQDSGNKSGDNKKKSKRPANTAFRQQRLKAWQPILTPKTVLPLFFSIGIIFAPIGGLLLYASSQVQELVIDYTNCYKDAPNGTDFASVPSDYISSQFKNKTDLTVQWRRETVNQTFDGVTNSTQNCSIQFQIPEDMGPPVLFYYQLTNFYQNHRRYVNSFDAKQLVDSDGFTSTSVSSDCDPLRTDSESKPYYPCGLIANSLFNDTFSNLTAVGSDGGNNYTMSQTGIAWASDKDLYKQISSSRDLSSVAVPPNWAMRYPNGYTTDNPPLDVGTDEHFMVWMRTAALPDFSKLYMRNDGDVLSKGLYQVDITNWFPVDVYKGTKSIVLSTRTVMGGRNSFLGIAYVVVGGICMLLGVLFTVTHLLKPRKLGDHTYLSWNNAPSSKPGGPSTAGVATGRDLGPQGQA